MNRTIRHQGFTLPEVAVVSGLMVVVTVATYPTMMSYYEHQKLEQAATELHAYLLRARSLAQRTDLACTITFTTTTLSATSSATSTSGGCANNLRALNLSVSNSVPNLCLSSSLDNCTKPDDLVFTGRGTLVGPGSSLFLGSRGVGRQFCLNLGLSLIRLGSRNGSEASCNFVRS